MAKQRNNQSFGDLRESGGSDKDFFQGVERMGKPRSTAGKRIAAAGVWLVILSFMLLTVLSALQVNTNRMTNVELRAMMETQYNPSFKTRYSDLGKEVIDAWYNQNPSPSPVQLAAGITWPHGATSDLTDYEADVARTEYSPSIAVRNVTFIGGKQHEAPGAEGMFYEINMYSAYVDGTLMTISVTFAIPSLDDYTTLPTLMNEPSVFPSEYALGSSIASNQPNWRNVTATDNFTEQLDSWAEAYATNNSNALKQITGDNSDSFYLGAISSKQWEYIENSAQVVWMKENNGNPEEAVAQVTFTMKLPDVTIPSPDNRQETIVREGETQVQRMEILVREPGSGLPLISAWGPVGSYLTLDVNTNRLTEENFNSINNSVRAASGGSENSGTSNSGGTGNTEETGTEDSTPEENVVEDPNPVDAPLDGTETNG